MPVRNADFATDSRPAKKRAKSRRLINTRLTVLLLFFAYSGLSVYSGNFLPLRLVNGESMEPALYSGDIILLKAMRFSDIKTGDVIAYKVPDAGSSASGPGIILHRVEKTAARNGQRVLITKGDNSSTDPWPVTSPQVQGKQILRIPLIGKPVVMLTSPRGILFVSIAILISLLYIPAMLMFHTTVLKKQPPLREDERGALGSNRLQQRPPDITVIDAVSGTEQVFGPMPLSGVTDPIEVLDMPPLVKETISPIVDAVEELSEEQRQVRESLTQLSFSIAEYATHLQSHTSAVKSLARVAELLEVNIQRQTDLMEQDGAVDSPSSQIY